jgi:hypothetical protein
MVLTMMATRTIPCIIKLTRLLTRCDRNIKGQHYFNAPRLSINQGNEYLLEKIQFIIYLRLGHNRTTVGVIILTSFPEKGLYVYTVGTNHGIFTTASTFIAQNYNRKALQWY